MFYDMWHLYVQIYFYCSYPYFIELLVFLSGRHVYGLLLCELLFSVCSLSAEETDQDLQESATTGNTVGLYMGNTLDGHLFYSDKF